MTVLCIIIVSCDCTRYPSEEDRVLAREIELSERDAMVARDEDLAHQLQLRENAYLTPRCSTLHTMTVPN